MRIVRDLEAVSAGDLGSHAAIGNFDGVHRGHRVIIDRVRRAAESASGLLSVVTFEPHPRSFFTPDLKPFRLTPAGQKERLLRDLGVDILFVFPFDAALAGMSAEEFAAGVLGRQLGLRTVAAGANFRFGHRRQAMPRCCAPWAPEAGYAVVVEPMAGGGGSGFSSSSIRAALAAGDPGEAARQLGYWHRIEGQVSPGAGQGRTLGMRTRKPAARRGLPPGIRGLCGSCRSGGRPLAGRVCRCGKYRRESDVSGPHGMSRSPPVRF